MPGLWFYSDPIDRLHHWALQRDKASRFVSQATPRHKRQELTRRAVAEVRRIVEVWGYRVTETTHKCAFDLWIEGVRVEVKASTYNPCKRGGRYQGHIKNHEADLVIFDCINGVDHLHVIPMIDICPRKHISVYSYNPAESDGQWQPYLGQWDFLYRAIEQSNHTWQPPLF